MAEETKRTRRRAPAKPKPETEQTPETPDQEKAKESSRTSVGDLLDGMGSVGAGGVHSESELAGLLASDDTAGATDGLGADAGAVGSGQVDHPAGEDPDVWIGAKWCSLGARACAALLAQKFGEACILDKEEADELGRTFDAWAARRFPAIPVVGNMEPDTAALLSVVGGIVAARVDIEAIIKAVNGGDQEEPVEQDAGAGGTVTALRFVPVESEPE